MRVRSRKRLHEDHSSHHMELVLIPETHEEAAKIDHVLGDIVLNRITVEGKVMLGNNFEPCILLVTKDCIKRPEL